MFQCCYGEMGHHGSCLDSSFRLLSVSFSLCPNPNSCCIFVHVFGESVEQAASSILEPFYPRLHEAGVAASSIPKELAVGFSPGDKRSAQAEVR